MRIILVDGNKKFAKEFEDSFKKTNRINIFEEMFEAYKWMKQDRNIPDIIVTELDFNHPTGLQSLKFLLTKSKLKNTAVIGFTNHPLAESEKALILSEGAAEVFEKEKLISGLSAYLKYLADTTHKQTGTGKTSVEKDETK